MINKKLESLAEYCIGNTAIDIGTDHGYLLIHLVTKMKFEKCLGIEINEGPFQNIKNNIELNNLDSKIIPILSNGLQSLKKKDIVSYENIIIAGMGGNLINEIIKNDYEKMKCSNLILQPNNNEKKVRKLLQELNFEIKCENIIEENGVFYSLIIASFTTNEFTKYNEEECVFGKNLENIDAFFSMWEKKRTYLKNLKQTLLKKEKEVPTKIEKELKMIEKKIK